MKGKLCTAGPLMGLIEEALSPLLCSRGRRVLEELVGPETGSGFREAMVRRYREEIV